jgi:hypothetical protein
MVAPFVYDSQEHVPVERFTEYLRERAADIAGPESANVLSYVDWTAYTNDFLAEGVWKRVELTLRRRVFDPVRYDPLAQLVTFAPGEAPDPSEGDAFETRAFYVGV